MLTWRVRALFSIPMLLTERLQIVPFEERHLTERYVAWLNDPIVTRFSEQRHRGHSLVSCAIYLELFGGTANRFLAIETRTPSKTHIGNITVAIDPPNRLADISIMIGDRNYWGQGFGVEAWSAVVNELLRHDHMRKVTGGAVAPNRGMIAIMRKCGMVEDGTRHGQYLVDGVPVDVHYFAAFSEGHTVAIGSAM